MPSEENYPQAPINETEPQTTNPFCAGQQLLKAKMSAMLSKHKTKIWACSCFSGIAVIPQVLQCDDEGRGYIATRIARNERKEEVRFLFQQASAYLPIKELTIFDSSN